MSLVNISCSATGKPDPDVVRILKERVKSSGVTTAHLTFSEISKEDAECTHVRLTTQLEPKKNC